jgi:hypothetical protein
MCFQTNDLYGRYVIKKLRMRSFYILFCGGTKQASRVWDGSASTTVTSRHRITFMLSANMGIKSTLVGIIADIVVGHYLLPNRVTANYNAIFWKLLYLACLKVCTYLQGRV